MIRPILFFLVSAWLCTVHGSKDGLPNYITEEEFASAESTPTLVPNGTQFNRPHNPKPPGPLARNAWRYSKWPAARVPYTVDQKFSKRERLAIATAFNRYHKSTCVRFVPKQSSDNDFVNIQRDDDTCGLAQVCRTGGEQSAKFGGSCINPGEITHELGHTLCFDHEESRSDRDQYISWDTSKCEPHSIDSANDWTTLDLFYDYVSLQHYEKECSNGCIQPKIPGVTKCGSGNGGLSVLDVEKINAYYECGGCHSYRFRPNSKLTSSDRALVVGSDIGGRDLYLCRTYVNGDIVPGKANLEQGVCYLPSNGEEEQTSSFEVLTNPKDANLQWVPKPTDGSFPSNAIPGGRSSEREPLYIGRCTVSTSSGDTTVPGHIHRSRSSNMYYSYGGKEQQCSNYEILVCS